MIGQKRFISYLDSWTIPPQFIILKGEEGSGRNTLIKLIKEKFKFDFITCGSSIEEVREISTLVYKLVKPTFYIFYNGDKLSNSAKNALLKIVEEPPKNAYFIIRVENLISETLVNRSFYYTMENYTYAEIKDYFSSCDKLEVFDKYGVICKNIGQAKIFLESPYEDIIDYCNIIIDKINNVAQGNIFNITNRLNLKEDLTKWNFKVFLNILEWGLYNRYIETKKDKYFQAIFRVINLRNKLKINSVNKQMLFDDFLLGLKDLL